MAWYETALMIVGLVTTSAVALLTIIAPITKWSGDNWLLQKVIWFRDKVFAPLAPAAVSKKLSP